MIKVLNNNNNKKENKMQTEQFDQVVDGRLKQVKSTLAAKADEYARGDRLSNFKKIAGLTGCTPEKVLMLLVSKHIVALTDFIDDLDSGQHQTMNRWDEKIGDIMAYMVLLDAMVIERDYSITFQLQSKSKI